MLGRDRDGKRIPIRSLTLWAEVNARAADFGEEVLGDRYMRLRFEDLCLDPVESVARIIDFFELEGDAASLAKAEIRPPGSLGRWRSHDDATVEELHRIAGDTLCRFGYLPQ